VLSLYTGGYPVHVDVRQEEIGGAGTAMRFTLPKGGLNFPLSPGRIEAAFRAHWGRRLA